MSQLQVATFWKHNRVTLVETSTFYLTPEFARAKVPSSLDVATPQASPDGDASIGCNMQTAWPIAPHLNRAAGNCIFFGVFEFASLKATAQQVFDRFLVD